MCRSSHRLQEGHPIIRGHTASEWQLGGRARHRAFVTGKRSSHSLHLQEFMAAVPQAGTQIDLAMNPWRPRRKPGQSLAYLLLRAVRMSSAIDPNAIETRRFAPLHGCAEMSYRNDGQFSKGTSLMTKPAALFGAMSLTSFSVRAIAKG